MIVRPGMTMGMKKKNPPVKQIPQAARPPAKKKRPVVSSGGSGRNLADAMMGPGGNC